MNTSKYTPKQIENFWKKVKVYDDPDACWEWVGSTTGNYGQIGIGGSKKKLAHRMAYELINGQVPENLDVLHSCDNPPCCNPKHLFLGTHADNMRDMVNKGRSRSLKGELHKQAKLTLSQVQTIRMRYEKGGVFQYELATEFGVHKSLISLIVRNKLWINTHEQD